MKVHMAAVIISAVSYCTQLDAQTVLSTNHATSTQTLKLSSATSFNTQQAMLWNLAKKQNGVIASDFRGKQEIGNAAAQRSRGDIDFWFPIDNFKRTFGGVVKEVKISDIDDPASSSTGFIDYDHNFHLIPIADYQEDFDKAIETANLRMDWKDPYVDPNHAVTAGWPDCFTSMRNRKVTEIECEIDFSKSNLKNFIDHNKPTYIKEKILSTVPDTLFTYGPWISDAGHCFKPEIHPAEQIWWKRQKSPTQEQYFLLLGCDQSGRYNDQSDFDVNEIVGKDRYLKNVWAPVPLKGTFALLFAVEKGKEVIQFDVNRISSLGVVPTPAVYKHYNLTLNSDTLVKVNYPGSEKLFKISFEQVFKGITTNRPDMVYGFLVIESIVGSSTNSGGYLFLDIKKTSLPAPNKLNPVIK